MTTSQGTSDRAHKTDRLPPTAKSTLSLARIEDIRDSENVLNADELRGCDLEAKIDGGARTPLEMCFDEFCMLAIGDEPDCHVCGVYEMGKSVCALLEAGAVQTPRVKAHLKELYEALDMNDKYGAIEYYCMLGASDEVREVLTCATSKMAECGKKRATAETPETETKGKKGKSK